MIRDRNYLFCVSHSHSSGLPKPWSCVLPSGSHGSEGNFSWMSLGPGQPLAMCSGFRPLKEKNRLPSWSFANSFTCLNFVCQEWSSARWCFTQLMVQWKFQLLKKRAMQTFSKLVIRSKRNIIKLLFKALCCWGFVCLLWVVLIWFCFKSAYSEEPGKSWSVIASPLRDNFSLPKYFWF